MSWQTLNTRSILSHVRMPEAFAVQLGLFEHAQCKFLREPLIGRPPEAGQASTANDLVGHEEIHSQPRLVDAIATSVDITWRGIAWRVTTAQDGDDVVYLIEPKELPQTPPLLIIEAGVLWGRPGGSINAGDHLLLHAGDSSTSVHVTAPCVNAACCSLATSHLAVALDQPIGVSTGRARSLEDIRALCSAGLHKRDQVLNNYGEHTELAGALYSALGWCTVYNAQENRRETTVSRVWASRNGGSIIFCWDSCFAAMMASALGEHDLAQDNIEAITSCIDANDYIPNLHNAIGAETLGQSQPPVASMALRYVCANNNSKPDSKTIERLLRWNRWWQKNRVYEGYLCWGSNPQTPRIGTGYELNVVGGIQGARFESGLDNSPMYDNATYNDQVQVMELADVGLLSIYIRDCLDLATLCADAGMAEEAEECQQRAQHFITVLDSLWDETAGIYKNKNLVDGSLSNRLSPTNFYPLLTGSVSPERAERMINEHLLNEEEFWGEWVLPSIARNDPAFTDQSYWRGRAWAPMNFLVYWSLKESGQYQAAEQLAHAGSKLFLRAWRDHGYIGENYNTITGQAGERSNSDPFNPWGALLALIGLENAGVVPALPKIPNSSTERAATLR